MKPGVDPTPRPGTTAPAGRVPATGGRAAQGTDKPQMPPGRAWLWFAIALLVNYWVAKYFLPSPEAPITIPYTLFKEEARKNNVKSIFSRGETMTGRLVSPITYPPPETAESKGEPLKAPGERSAPRRGLPRTSTSFATTLPAFVDPGLEQFLIDHGVEISAEPIDDSADPLTTLLFGFGPALLLIAFYVWLFRRAAQSGGGLGGGLWA